jgi:hypothetical protein
MDSLPMIYEGKLYGKIGSRYIPLKMTSDDVDELEQRHNEFCTRLQECVQKHQIGLAGERIDQLVCDHIEAQASQIEAMREAIQEAHDAFVDLSEYWNKDQNENAMADACWHTIETSLDAITKLQLFIKP